MLEQDVKKPQTETMHHILLKINTCILPMISSHHIAINYVSESTSNVSNHKIPKVQVEKIGLEMQYFCPPFL